MRTVEYELMRPPEIAQARARLPLAFIPIGPLEWHGPHLPMGMDGLHAHTVAMRSEEHTSELQSRENLVCRLLLEKKKKIRQIRIFINQNTTTINKTSLQINA